MPRLDIVRGGVVDIEQEMKMALNHSLLQDFELCENDSQKTATGTAEASMKPWVYPVMYGLQFIAADCSTLLTAVACQMYLMDHSNPRWFYGSQAVYVISNALLASSLTNYLGKRIFKHPGSWGATAIATLLGSMIHVVAFNVVLEGEVESDEIVTLMVITFTVPASFSVIGYNIVGGTNEK